LLAEKLDTELITREKVLIYDLTLSHNTSVTYRQTTGDRRQSCYRRLQHSCSASKTFTRWL